MDKADALSNLETMSDDKLVRLVGKGDERALKTLLIRYIPMVRKQAKSFKFLREDVDDLSQEGLVALADAVHSYRFDSDASFGTFAYTCVRNRMISVLRHQSSASKTLNIGIRIEELDFKEDNLELLHNTVTPEEVVMSKEESERFHNFLIDTLSPLEYNVLILYSMAFSYDEIANRLSITSKSVDNALQRIRKKLSFETFE